MSPSLSLAGASRIRVRAGATMAAAIAAAGLVAGCGVSGETISGCSPDYVSLSSTAASADVGGATEKPDLPQDVSVTLPTGQRVLVDGTEATPVTTGKGSALGSGYVDLNLAGDEYMIPDAAVPYLGSVLDPRLFDVSYLARAEQADPRAAGLPVTLTYSNKGPAVALPGVTVTHHSAGTATGTITASQAPDLGKFLASQWGASASGQSQLGAGRLPGISRISLAQPSGAPALPALPTVPAASSEASGQSQQLPYHTLTVDFTGADSSATEVGEVMNVSDARLGTYLISPFLSGSSTFGGIGEPGPFRLSLPDGTYSLAFSIVTPHPGANDPAHGEWQELDYDSSLVVKPQVTVDSNETITLDASTAKPYNVAISPAVTSAETLSRMGFTRISQTGGGCGGYETTVALGLVSASGDGYPGGTISASPTQPVTMGTMGFDAYSTIWTDPDATQTTPTYYLNFPSENRIPQSLSYTVSQKDLTTVQEHLYTSASCPVTTVSPTVFEPWGDYQSMSPGAADSLDHTDYWYTSNPSLTWWQNEFTASTPKVFCNSIFGAVSQIHPGEVSTQSWGKGPNVPSPVSVTAESPGLSVSQVGSTVDVTPSPVLQQPQLTICPACRQDDNAMLYLPSFGDSDPTHFKVDNGLSTSLDFYRNGVPAVLSQDDPSDHDTFPFGLELPLLPGSASYQLDYGVTGTGQTPMLGAGESTQTDWTFSSSSADPAASLPNTEECAPDSSRSCSFLPLLYLSYDLALNASNEATAGQPFDVSFTVEHQQNEPPPSGVSATLSESFDGGQTWTAPQDATSQGGDQFTATVQQPALSATNGYVSLRVTAHDGAGDAVTQTIIDAYGLSG